MPDTGLIGSIRSRGPRRACAAALAAVLLLAVNIAGCYSRVTVTNPRGATTQDLELGQDIEIKLRDGHKIRTVYRGMKDGDLLTDSGRYALDQVHRLSYWIDDEPGHLPIPCCAVMNLGLP